MKAVICTKYGSYNNDKYFRIHAQDADELTITRFDPNRRIVSGRFWFDATTGSGEKVEVREGRFDIGY
jgi:hypothetical protein